MEAERIGARAQDRGAENIGRHQVGSGLDALEAEAEKPPESLHDERLGDARNAFEQRVALAEDSDQHFFDYCALARDHPAQLGTGMDDQLIGRAQRLRQLGPGRVQFGRKIRVRCRFLAHEALSCELIDVSFDGAA